MAHNIDSIAYRGSRNDVWHRLGHEYKAGEDWAVVAGLAWTAVKVPALADLSSIGAVRLADPTRDHVSVPGDRYIARSDNGHILGHVSDRYQPVQPKDVLDWFAHYTAHDDRFQLDVAGSLKAGEIIWATATFNGNMDVAGDGHIPRLLMTTTFDGTGSTINRATMTRVVCNNTLDAALADRQKSLVRTRHSTRFDAARVRAELGSIVKGFEAYKAMGEAMAGAKVAPEEVSRLFKHVLDIPFDTPKGDISTRKLNQFAELNQALTTTRGERGETNATTTAWTALNAVTRWADHDRSTRGDGDAMERRFTSSTIQADGSGQKLKSTAVEYLMATAMKEAGVATEDFSALLAQPFKPAAERV
jgi:phage/plasmid-like protein (TIGR03299 family)